MLIPLRWSAGCLHSAGRRRRAWHFYAQGMVSSCRKHCARSAAGCAILHHQGQGPTWNPCPQEDRNVRGHHRCPQGGEVMLS
eukprot:6455868-Amphidinium_carterae.1